eukprot:s2287_g4.t1
MLALQRATQGALQVRAGLLSVPACYRDPVLVLLEGDRLAPVKYARKVPGSVPTGCSAEGAEEVGAQLEGSPSGVFDFFETTFRFAMADLAEISNGNLKLSLDASGWRLSSKGLCLTGWILEVYSHDGSQMAQTVFDLRQAEVQRQQVQVPGLGTAPGIVISGGHWQLQWALSEAAALFQLEVLPTSSSSIEHSSSRSELLASSSIEHFCVPFHVDSTENELSEEFQPPGVEVQEDEGCCWEKRKKRTSMQSSMLVNGWQSFGFSMVRGQGSDSYGMSGAMGSNIS